MSYVYVLCTVLLTVYGQIVIKWQVLAAGVGQNPARQASVNAGIPKETPAWGINQLCGSGLRAVALGMQQILSGDAKIVAAGGQESMSRAPHAAYLREGVKMGDYSMVDTMIKDGLWDAFNGYHMGTTAENVANQWQITRDMQDAFAVKSQNKAEAAQAAGKFKDEIAPVTISSRKGDVVVDQDEYIKKGVTLEGVQKLKPAFAKDGSVTAANASGINDGAAAGQTVPHLHIHLIPRYNGDSPDPRGGVRWIVPDKADYWSKR